MPNAYTEWYYFWQFFLSKSIRFGLIKTPTDPIADMQLFNDTTE
jgi:hypothetical protein